MAGNPIPTFPIPNRDRNRVQNPQGMTQEQTQQRLDTTREAQRKRLDSIVGPPAGRDYRKGSPR
jgi:hypothetical protein